MNRSNQEGKRYIPSGSEIYKAEERMTQEEEAASAERELSLEKKRPILIVYRDNDFFSEIVPKMADQLRAAGRTVEVQAFSRDVDLGDVPKWFAANSGNLQGRNIVTDRTVSDLITGNYGDYHLEKTEDTQEALESVEEVMDGLERLGEISFKAKYLDNIDYAIADALTDTFVDSKTNVSGVTSKEILSDKVENKESEEFLAEVIISIFRAILQKKENVPAFINIERRRIRDHIPLSNFRDKTPSGFEDENDNDAVEEVIRWLKSAGVPDDVVISTGKFGEPKSVVPAGSVSWEIFDRHTGPRVGSIEEDEDGRTLSLPLPLSNLIQTVAKWDIFPPEVQTKVLEKIKEKFNHDFHLES